MSYTPPAYNAADLSLSSPYVTPANYNASLYLAGGMEDVNESASSNENFVAGIGVATVESAALGLTHNLGIALAQAETLGAADNVTNFLTFVVVETIDMAETVAASTNTATLISENITLVSTIQAAISQIVAESANAADGFSIDTALSLVELISAVTVHQPTYNIVVMVAELIAAADAINGADGYDVTESAAFADTYAARVQAIVNLIEQAQLADTLQNVIHTYQAVTESANATVWIKSEGSLYNMLVSESVVAVVKLNIGGEAFTGWVLNADSGAASEYQFQDLSFNSACKHGDTYLMAADDGIYQFTDEVSEETVITYLKTGKMDFGSDYQKRVQNAYMAYSATGKMQLRVTVNELGQIQTYRYNMTPAAGSEGTNTSRIGIGKGIRSRYWQLELVGEDADSTFDEIGILPVILSRRV